MKIKFGGKQLIAFAACIMVVILSGCSPAICLELRNEGDETVYVCDFRKKIVAVQSRETVFVDLPGKKLLLKTNKQQSFDLSRVPAEHVHTTRRGLVVYAVLSNDGLLFLATKMSDGKLKRVEPQPESFPLQGLELQP